MAKTMVERRDEIREALNVKMAEQDNLAAHFEIDGENVTIPDAVLSDFSRSNSEAKSLQTALEGLEQAIAVKEFMDSPDKDSAAAAYAAAEEAGLIEDGALVKSIGEQFTESDIYRQSVANGGGQHITLDRSPYAVKALHAGSPTSYTTGFGAAGSFREVDRGPIVDGPRRMFWIRDLFPKRTTTKDVIEYYQNLGFTINRPITQISWTAGANDGDVQPGSSGTTAGVSFTLGTQPSINRAAIVAQAAASVPTRGDSTGVFGSAPQSELAFRPDSATVRRISHWEVVHRNLLDDEPSIRAIIDNEVLYGLRLTEDQQILFGDGGGENLKGILGGTVGGQTGTTRTLDPNYDYVQGYLWSSGPASKYAAGFSSGSTPAADATALVQGDTKIDAVRRALTLAYLRYYRPTGAVFHPGDWEDMELQKNSLGAYYLPTNISMGAEQKVWRVPVIDTPAINEGQALVGSFGMGAQVHDRQQAQIRMSESHGTLFVESGIVILAEERLCLTVPRPESFVRLIFDSAPAVA